MVFQSVALKPFSINGTYLFETNDGYGEGRICNMLKESVEVELFRHTQKILLPNSSNISEIPKHQLVCPKRSFSFIRIPTSCKYASGYFHPGFYENMSGKSSLPQDSLSLSGLSINLKESIQKSANSDQTNEEIYLISNCLTFHGDSHYKLFHQLFNIINIHCIRYLRAEINLLEMPLDEITWMLNMLFYIDDYSPISKEVVSTILKNFLTDYTQMSLGSWIRSPLNYLLDYHQIRGVFWKNRAVLFVPAYQENIIYGH